MKSLKKIIFATSEKTRLNTLFINKSVLGNSIFKITYPPCLHLCSTLGGFSRFNQNNLLLK